MTPAGVLGEHGFGLGLASNGRRRHSCFQGFLNRNASKLFQYRQDKHQDKADVCALPHALRTLRKEGGFHV